MSVFATDVKTAGGIVPTGTTKFEKRGIAVTVPEWPIDKCIQCGTCLLYTSRCV